MFGQEKYILKSKHLRKRFFNIIDCCDTGTRVFLCYSSSTFRTTDICLVYEGPNGVKGTERTQEGQSTINNTTNNTNKQESRINSSFTS